LAPTPGLLPYPLIEACLEFFYGNGNVFPTQPILPRGGAQELIQTIEQSLDAYCVIAALCANVIIQGNMTVAQNILSRPEMGQHHAGYNSYGEHLLSESIRIRQGALDYRDHPNYLSVLTSWFYYGCYYTMSRDNEAWMQLREATAQAELLGMQDELHGHSLDHIIPPTGKRVLYWLLLTSERYDSHPARAFPLALCACFDWLI
jgi:hypothetical protein